MKINSLSLFVNTNRSFLLKDIIEWCNRPSNKGNPMSECIIQYINDNYLHTKKYLNKRFKVKYTLFRKSIISLEAYNKYLGFSIECVNA